MKIYPKNLLFLSLLLFTQLLESTSSNQEIAVKCSDKEIAALLKFKAEVTDDYGRLSTWGGRDHKDDCCSWQGVRCNARTNRVASLALPGPKVEDFTLSTPLRGNISRSLIELVDLNYLDLSNNDFSTIPIPEFIGSLGKLAYLNLSRSNFVGLVPQNLGNLSMLRVLDLSGNEQVSAEDLNWLAGFRSLVHLDLSRLYFYKVKTWLRVINELAMLEHLNLGNCGLHETLLTSFFPPTNGSSPLAFLDLSNNNLDRFSILLWFSKFSSRLTYISFASNNDEIDSAEANIPDSLWNLTSLSYLDLSDNNLKQEIPSALGNMTSLSYIDFSSNKFEGSIPHTLGNMVSLTYLDLSSNNLEGGFPKSNGNLKQLVRLRLNDNKLEGDLTYMNNFLSNSTKLEFLELSRNKFYGSLPPLSRFSFLRILSLDSNQLNGSFSETVLNLPDLIILDLSGNRLTGELPDLASCSSLELLNLNDNMFDGTLTESIGHLSKLNFLDLHSNRFEGTMSEKHFFNLSQLGVLDLSLNSNLTLNISPEWNPLFQLGTIKLSYCKLGPNFPKWLQKQRKIFHLDISSSDISDTIPNWFWENSRILDYLNISHNKISGPFQKLYSVTVVDVSSNEFNGSLPILPYSMQTIDLSRNRFSGGLYWFCNSTYAGTIADLSDNLLSGEISKDCFKNLVTLDYLNLSNNNFTGEIPSLSDDWYCTFTSLHLRNNTFRGEIPSSLKICDRLQILDLGENSFTGKIPTWIGEKFPDLGILSLRSNELNGTIPSTLCRLQNIQILDLSVNKFSGTIPRCISNFTLMGAKPGSNRWLNGLRFLVIPKAAAFFYDNAYITWKGQVSTYSKTLGLLIVVDLSSNDFSGQIPPEITGLEGLVALNLSRNSLVGTIPQDIDRLDLLNFLDLSENNISGNIPLAVSRLSHLGVLDLSFNNLSGRIPWVDHLLTFDASVYKGNLGLCGPPLVKLCLGDEVSKTPKSANPGNEEMEFGENQDKFLNRGFYISLVLGFIVGFWVIFGSLFLTKFRLLIGVERWLLVKMGVEKGRLRRYFQNQ
ncbi:hypothetical protein ABFS83_05G104200 [Erythranthe nasuta]